MHMAAQGNQPLIIDRLLNHYEAYDINVADQSGATPLIWASFCGSEVALTYILAQPGLDINH